MERYSGVHGKERVRRISKALEAGGAEILIKADPSSAPFTFRIRLPNGEELDLICYAFTANKYRQRNRPADEHRMQVKYGGDFTRAHNIHLDPSRTKLTLFFGVHHSSGAFIAVDPAMHNPTWFSSSIEFKEEEVERTIATGWHGWERDRLRQGRRRVTPMEDLRTEILLGVTAEHFLRYVLFERVATGLDPGERLLLIDGIAKEIESGAASLSTLTAPESVVIHPLETQLGLSAREILDVIGGRFRLLTAVRGSVAEHHLEQYLRSDSDITDVCRIDEDGQPDFAVQFRGRTRQVRIECKNVLRRRTPNGPRVDFQKTRASKNDPCSRYYSPTQFEVLAACLHPLTEVWEFRFRETAVLTPHRSCTGRLSERVLIEEPPWTASLPEILERLTSK